MHKLTCLHRLHAFMPISIDHFESDDIGHEPSVPKRVVRFLAANDDQAFTRTEIATAIDADPNTVSTALTRLESRHLVRHRGDYWAITTDDNRLQGAVDLHTASTALDREDAGIDADAWDAVAPEESHPSEHSSDTSRSSQQ